jgi:hypothetical protein
MQKVTQASAITSSDSSRPANTDFSRLRVPVQVAELILSHKKQGMVEVYDQREYLEEKRDALHKWAVHIEAVAGMK